MKPERTMMPFPDGYPELLEQIGQIIFSRLARNDIAQERITSLTFEITEAIRTEIGGVQQYIPRGLSFDLSQRDAEIWAKFNGNNYQALAHEFSLTEMQVRNIVKRARARDTAQRQSSLLPSEEEN